MMIRCHVLRKYHLCDQKNRKTQKKKIGLKLTNGLRPCGLNPHGSIHKKREALLILKGEKDSPLLLNVAAVKNAQVCFSHGSFLVCMVVFFLQRLFECVSVG